jgi:hypothetical protein
VNREHEAIEELLAGYAVGSLSGRDAADADRVLAEHVPGCAECRDTLAAFTELGADLALAVDPRTPPDTLLARLHRAIGRTPPRRSVQAFAVVAGVAAVVGLAGLAVSQGMRARDANARAEDLRAATELAMREDADRTSVGPVSELSAPGVDEFYVLGSDVPAPPAGSAYAVWIVSKGRPTFVGEFLPEEGRVFLTVPFDPDRYDDLWISVEPEGSEPTAPTDVRWRASDAASQDAPVAA